MGFEQKQTKETKWEGAAQQGLGIGKLFFVSFVCFCKKYPSQFRGCPRKKRQVKICRFYVLASMFLPFTFRLVSFCPSRSLLEFRETGRFQKQLDCLGDIAAGFLGCFSLADDVQFRAQRHEILFRTLDDGGQRKSCFAFHAGILRQLNPNSNSIHRTMDDVEFFRRGLRAGGLWQENEAIKALGIGDGVGQCQGCAAGCHRWSKIDPS
jgi:hypothetical protein